MSRVRVRDGREVAPDLTGWQVAARLVLILVVAGSIATAFVIGMLLIAFPWRFDPSTEVLGTGLSALELACLVAALAAAGLVIGRRRS
jgi:hypothetical protein